MRAPRIRHHGDLGAQAPRLFPAIAQGYRLGLREWPKAFFVDRAATNYKLSLFVFIRDNPRSVLGPKLGPQSPTFNKKLAVIQMIFK